MLFTYMEEIKVYIASTSIPNKHVIIRPNDIPWMNNTIRTLIKRGQKTTQNGKTSEY